MSLDITESLRSNFQSKFPGNNFNYTYAFGNSVVRVEPNEVVPLLRHLKDSGQFDFLMNISGVDYPDRKKRFEVNYELFSSRNAQRLRIKTQIAEGETIPTATSVWRGANWFEREIYDMFGVKFEGHLNMRRLLVHQQFEGFPLRKDYPADRQQHCTEALPIHFDVNPERPFSLDEEKDLVPLNIGPSHPATHGTLRVMALLDGEKVHRAGVELGYLHRCFEKMAETHPYNQVIPYTDRLNYCSAPMNNVGYCKAVETLLGVDIPPKAKAIRIILCELSRIIDHIVCIGANAVDLGALTGFFHLFTYREKVYTLFEKLCGARLTVSLTRVGGMANNPPENWYKDVLEFCDEMSVGVDELDTLLTGNKIWMQRTQDVGAISAERAIEWGYTGPLLRAAGVPLDLRKTDPYYGYDQLDFDIPTGTTGDVFDRYLVRVAEMRESIKIIRQVAKNIPEGDYTIRDKGIVLPEKKDVYGNIEGLMNHFMLVIKGLRPPAGEIYDATEAANGELGFYLVSDNSGNPYRLKVRPPCFAIYQSFAEQVEGGLVADVISILGSMNLIAGELDR
ncbi:MAG: NADH-quinone oxidoreductase subunit C [Bdellovibrionaceae bacterium]|nr:NADH-quinone oxidoreductase subunit C [Pseudobdellovibrionaceae bacterium]|tara:strand:+ start:10160 stop:11851 length:1692 start_codon:yes stop_codon:yes gene_type:complete